jgi:alpha-glucosidase (family GH31 glycosyl hydrolase)
VTGGFGDAITPLVMEISSQTMQRLHVKIYDPNNKRWEVPTSMSPAPDDPATPPTSTLYNYKYPNVGEKFYLTIMRASDGAVIFDTTGQTFSMFDQYLSLSTHLPDNYNIYGLGEHVTPFLKLQQRTYTLWNFDTATPPYLNLYGSHPFYLEVRPGGSAHGVFLRNSNGMDVILSDNSLTYNTIGGIFDLYFFMGPQPESVIRQYQEVIGSPHMPPYWGLGFHQCRYGYHSINDIQDVVENYAKNKIPLDTMWTDIDYMDQVGYYI